MKVLSSGYALLVCLTCFGLTANVAAAGTTCLPDGATFVLQSTSTDDCTLLSNVERCCSNAISQAVFEQPNTVVCTCGLLIIGPSNTPTPAATPTNTGEPTRTAEPIGADCAVPSDCVSGNCVNDVCCVDPACGAGESCDNPPTVGICSPDGAPAPALSPSGVLLALAILIGLGGVAMLRRRHGA